MADTTKLLEDRVLRAVDRLQQLHEERDKLRDEVRTLRHQVEHSEKGSGVAIEREDRSDEGSWGIAKAEVVAAVREAIDELRGE